MLRILGLLAIGLLTGGLAGVFGIGGGVILVPLLVLLLGYPQAAASGTSLVALLLPVGILGAWEYLRAGKISPEHVRSGFLISAGILVGTFLGAKVAVRLPPTVLRKAFSVFLILVAAKLWWTEGE